jgi:UDP-glucose 4-epimerase
MKWSTKRVLVTGGVGFIGSRLVFTLLDLGANLTVVDKLKIRGHEQIWHARLEYYKQTWKDKGFKLCEEYLPRYNLVADDNIALQVLDLERDVEEFEKILRKRDIDIVFHMAAVFGGRGFVDTRPADCCAGFGINHNVISTSYRANVKHVHFASSACVYPPSLNKPSYLLKEDDILSTGEGWKSSDNSYGFVKLMGELELKSYYEQYGLEGSTARYLTVYGPGEFDDSHAIAAFIRRALAKEDPFVVWGNGLQERGFTYVDDIVRGIIRCVEVIKDVTPINLGWDKRYKIKEIVEIIISIAEYKPKVIYDETKPVGPLSRALDITRAKTLLGWNPKVDIKEGLINTYRWAVEYLPKMFTNLASTPTSS